MATAVISPGTSPYTTSWDSSTELSVAETTFAALRSGSPATNILHTSSSLFAHIFAGSTTNKYTQLSRIILLFDTSFLTANAHITSAKISLWGQGKSNSLGSHDLVVVSHTPGSISVPSTSDYALARFGTTEFSNVSYALFSTTGYNDLFLNSAGLASINKTGTTAFGLMVRPDFANNEAGLTWGVSLPIQYNIKSVDAAGVANDPLLTIDYEVYSEASGSAIKSMFSAELP